MRDLDRFMEEDFDGRGDVTTQALFGTARRRAAARLFARERVVVAGVTQAAEVFERLGCRATWRAPEGRILGPRRSLLEVAGPLAGILAGERLALNLLGRMSGIATTTRGLVERVRRVNPRCQVAATRKTTPGFRAYEKLAVTWGGGHPHREGLFDGILIKDNHLDAFGDVAAAVARARGNPWGLPVEVEVSRLADAEAAVRAGADWLLVDNLAPPAARRIADRARRIDPDVRIEVSGGLNETNLVRYAPFADRLSLGALTHSARSADVTLELRVPKH